MKLVISVWLIAIVSVMVLTFNTSLPKWCAEPSGSGNWVVVPLCK